MYGSSEGRPDNDAQAKAFVDYNTEKVAQEEKRRLPVADASNANADLLCEE